MWRKMVILMTATLTPCVVTSQGIPDQAKMDPRVHKVASYNEAATLLMRHVYNTPPVSVTTFCNCRFHLTGQIDLRTCGIADDIEYGHLREQLVFMPAVPAALANHFSCYREPNLSQGGNRPDIESPEAYCARTDRIYGAFVSDSHNLFPVSKSLHLARQNNNFGVIPGEAREFGTCDFESNDRYTEPKPYSRGRLARAVLYTTSRYGIRLSPRNLKVYENWDKENPPSEFEIWRNDMIEWYQGNANPFISRHTAAEAPRN